MIFQLTDDHYIENTDDRNWTLCAKYIKKDGEVGRRELAYHPSLKACFTRSVERLALKKDTVPELRELIERLEELKLKL